jgi:hypothetical protein
MFTNKYLGCYSQIQIWAHNRNLHSRNIHAKLSITNIGSMGSIGTPPIWQVTMARLWGVQI